MLALFLLLFLLSSQIQCRRLTTEENELNSKKCGVHFLEQAVCSGVVQISPRHILTAAHRVLVFDVKERFDLCLKNQSNRLHRFLLSMPEDIVVAIGGGKIHCNNDPCQYNKALYTATKITVKEVKMCDADDDLALIELSQNILESDSTPICMPEFDLQLKPVLYASGIGMDPSSPITFDNPNGDIAHGQQVVALRYLAVDHVLHQIVTVTFAKTICQGDSGGPLFQVNEDGRHILVGINSNILGSCTHHSENIGNVLTDVRAHSDWICKYSGVCALEEESI